LGRKGPKDPFSAGGPANIAKANEKNTGGHVKVLASRIRAVTR
jgi:hypothetical protein